MLRYQRPRYLFRRFEVMRAVTSGDVFLEVGPGRLELAQEMLTRFRRGVLVDFNSEAVKAIFEGLDAPFKQRLELIISDFSTFQGFRDAFNCVVACEVMEHIEDDRAFLRRARELLVDSGQIILSVPARQRYWSIDDTIVGHFRRYEKQGLQQLLEQSGFRDVAIVSYGFPFQNLVRLLSVAVAWTRQNERGRWGKKRQSQESAFLLTPKPWMDWIALFVNKYTFYPLSLAASAFNSWDLGDGYVVSAIKAPPL